MGQARSDLAGLQRLIERAPAARVTGLLWRRTLPSFSLPVLLHAPAYLTAYRGGAPAFSFTRTMSLPIHYRPGQEPPRAPTNLEWQPKRYDPQADYARAFPLVLAHAPAGLEEPRALVPGLAPQQELKVLEREGDWWLLAPGQP